MLKENFILVAEDDIDDQQMLQSIFLEKDLDIPLRFVGNGLELIEYLEKVKTAEGEAFFPRFILLDLNMPKMNGQQALQTLQADANLKDIPVIVFSTTENPQEISRCYALGAKSYVVKPSSYKGLLQAADIIKDFWLQFATRPAERPS